MSDRKIYSVPVLLAVVLLPMASNAASAQQSMDQGESFVSGTHISFGYVANAPDQFLGVTAMILGIPRAGWGIYADFKLTTDRGSGEDNFTEARTAEEAEALGDVRFGEVEPAWNTVNLGVVRALVDEVAVYAGAGYSRETVYQEYFDNLRERGNDGFYVVEDERVGGDQVNLMAGLYLRASRLIMFQFGAETAPSGFTAGVSFVLPL